MSSYSKYLNSNFTGTHEQNNKHIFSHIDRDAGTHMGTHEHK